MKFPLLILTFLLLLGCNEKADKEATLSPADLQSTINNERKENLNWHTNIEEAFSLAKHKNKNLIIMVSEENCRWCVKMKKNTLTDLRVQKAMKKYVLVTIKRSDKDVLKVVPEFDGNIPSFFFMEKNRELMESLVGYYNADDFLEYITQIEEE